VEQIARMEMARLFKKDPGALEVGLWDLPVSARQSAGQQGMAVACAHDDVGPLLDAFEARDLSVRAIVPRICGMLRACRAWLAPAPQVSFVLDLGWSVVRLIAVRQGVIVSERTIDGADFRGLRAEAEKATAMPPEMAELILDGDAAVGGESGPGPDARLAGCIDRHAERIAEQVNVSLAYIGHRYGVGSAGRVLLVGEHGATPGLAARIGALLGAECRAVAPGDIALASAGAVCGGATATVAAGVALLAQEEGA
jgi:Tfp pilus assembly PilM family ATPase